MEARPKPMVRPRALVLRAPGTNCHKETAEACAAAGGKPEEIPLQVLLERPERLLSYQMLIIPGGFTYGDHLGAGKVLGLVLRKFLGDYLDHFVAAGRAVLGICNGFQALLWSGLLPSPCLARRVTLAPNAHGLFECRWVNIAIDDTCLSPFLRGLEGTSIAMPVAHAEGRFLPAKDAEEELLASRTIALRYVSPTGSHEDYPWNPNGSWEGVAGLCNPSGNVLGLMPHPERASFHWQMPHGWRPYALRLFANVVNYCRGID